MKPYDKACEKYRVGVEGFRGFEGTSSGAFRIGAFGVIVSVDEIDGERFEHVSVSLAHRVPNAAEMRQFRAVYFRSDEDVHYVANSGIGVHDNTGHMFRRVPNEEEAATTRWITAGGGEA